MRAGALLPETVKQLNHAHTETPGKPHKDPHARITLTALDAADIGKGKAAGVGDLLLREAAFGADSEDVSAEAVERIAGHDRIVVA